MTRHFDNSTLYSQGVLALLRRKLQQGQRADRLQVISILALAVNDEQVAELLLEAVELPDPLIKAKALEALMKGDRGRVVPLLLTMLHDPNADLRRLAVQMLGQIKSLEVAEPLLEALKDKSSWVRWEAVEAVVWIGTPRSAALVAERLADLEPRVRRRACEAFAMGLTPAPLNSLMQTLSDSDQWVRFWAVEALREHCDKGEVRLALLRSLYDVPVVRNRAIRVLGYAKAVEVIPHLDKLLEGGTGEASLLALIRSACEHFHGNAEAESIRAKCVSLLQADGAQSSWMTA